MKKLVTGLFSSEEHDRSLSHFDTIPACDRQSDSRTDGRILQLARHPADAV